MRDIAALYARDLARLTQEVEAFAAHPDAFWQTAPGVTNSAGTLALHLEGNLREYIGRQLGGIAYVRRRDLEFSARDVSVEEMARRMAALRDEIPPVVALLPAAIWEADFPEPMWGAKRPAGQMVIHLLGHLNYHLGQIDYLRRVLTGRGALDLAAL